MKPPVIYLYTEEANTQVLICPRFIEVISRDYDAYTENDESDQRPLSPYDIVELSKRNEEFTTNLTALLTACRKLVYPRADQHEDGYSEILNVIERFNGF